MSFRVDGLRVRHVDERWIDDDHSRDHVNGWDLLSLAKEHSDPMSAFDFTVLQMGVDEHIEQAYIQNKDISQNKTNNLL